MKMNHFSKVVMIGLLAGFGLSSSAQAASCIDEGAGYADSLAFAVGTFGNSGCFVGLTNSDKIGDTLHVNDHALFGHQEWEFLSRLDRFGASEPPNVPYGDFEFTNIVTNAGLIGEFSVASTIFDSYSAYMIVVKGGNSVATPDDYIGYIFTEEDGVEGVIHSPFTSVIDGTARRFSHLTLYATQDVVDFLSDPSPSPIPLPAAAWGLLAGLGVLVGLKWRRKFT